MVDIWYAILCLMAATYAVLDGQNLGVAAVGPLVARDEAERTVVRGAIRKLWAWDEVWLVAAAGVFLLAFPEALAALFSGFYLPIFVIVWLLVGRGVSMELGELLEHPLWRAFWRVALGASSTLLALLFGVYVGNLVRGVPVDRSGELDLALFTTFRPSGDVGLLDWYTLSTGALCLALLAAHGAAAITAQATPSLRDRARRRSRQLWVSTLVLGAVVLVETLLVRPDLAASLGRPAPLLCVAIVVLGAFTIATGFLHRSDHQVRVAACILVGGLVLLLGAVVHPTLVRSTLDPSCSIAATRGPGASGFALVWWGLAAIVTVTIVTWVNQLYDRRPPDAH